MLEQKKAGDWVNIDYWQYNEYYEEDRESEEEYSLVEVYSGRSYSLFTELAKVRDYNESKSTMGDPKGIPKDIHSLTKRYIDSWAGDGHSHSYHSLKELKDFDGTAIDTQVQYLIEAIEKRLNEYKSKDDEDFRIVFFFDN